MAKTSKKKLDLIPELTTHKNDYKQWPIPVVDLCGSSRVDDLIVRKSPLSARIDYQSHLQYMKYVPFDLYFSTKPIVGKDPRDPIPVVKEPDEFKSNDFFSYTLPAKSTMDVTQKDLVRALLIGTYSIPRRNIMKDACLKSSTKPEPPRSVLIKDRLTFSPELYSPLPYGWLSAASHWDCLQNRVLGDPTKTFWLRRGPEVECFSKADPNETIPKEVRCEIHNLIEEDRLRLPYDITKTGYGGYRQMNAKGVPLARNKDFDF